MTDYIIINIKKEIELGSLTKKIQEALNLDNKKNIYIRENKLYIEAPSASQNVQTVENLISAHSYQEETDKLKDIAHEFSSTGTKCKLLVETLKNIGKLTELEYNSFIVEYKKLHKIYFPDIKET